MRMVFRSEPRAPGASSSPAPWRVHAGALAHGGTYCAQCRFGILDIWICMHLVRLHKSCACGRVVASADWHQCNGVRGIRRARASEPT